MSKISLCVIARDESANIGDCIKTFAGAFDEAVVIDTGSSDDTIAKAREAGAKAQLYQWRDDYAAARQFSFDQATGDWLLWCDADDRLEAGSAAVIRAAVESDDADVYFINRNVDGFTVPREFLVRRGVGKWDRTVHERLVFQDGTRTRKIEATMRHPKVLGKKASHDRNLELLQRATANTPMDLFYLATELHVKGHREQAIAVAESALKLGLGPVEQYELLILCALTSKAWQEQEKYALSAYYLMPGRREAVVFLSQSAMRRGEKARALSFARMIHGIPKPKETIWTLQNNWYGWDGIDLLLCYLRANGLYKEAADTEQKVRKNAEPAFTLVHATRGRPKQMIDCRNRWFDLAKHPEGIEHIFCIDADDKEAAAAAEEHWRVTVPAGGGCVAAWNAGAKLARGQVLIQLSDDWIPPVNWDELILDRLGDKVDGEAVLAVSDGIDRGGGQQTKCLCMAILTKQRYLYQGHMFYRGYKSVYSDNEFTDRAYADGVVVEARDITFQHVHPVTGKVAEDATYKAQNAPERYRDGEATYLARKQPTQALAHRFGALILAAKDDFCLWEVCKRMAEEGVRDFFFGIPEEYWNGKENTQDNAREVMAVADKLKTLGFNARVLALDVAAHRAPGRPVVITEAMVRNELLGMIRGNGIEHVLVVDGDELWKRGALLEVDRYVTDNAPNSISIPIIPVAGLPGYPIRFARDGAMIYLGPRGTFGSCRGQAGDTCMFPRRLLYHFTATRKTMEEIIQKTRESGHFDDPRYAFEEWIANTLPNIKPGMKRAHMFVPEDTWPVVGEWRAEDLAEIPESLHPYLGVEKVKMKYSQNDEEFIIAKYFGDHVGTFLDIGAYTGKELSNTRALMERGWRGMCVEASPRCFEKLKENCAGFPLVFCVQACVGKEKGEATFYDSLEACATTDQKHYEKWSPHIHDWQKITVPVVTAKEILDRYLFASADFISIDTEGMDFEILQQLDLAALGTRMLCIEFGTHLKEIHAHMLARGFKLHHQNNENVIYIL